MGDGPALIQDAEAGNQFAISAVEKRGVTCQWPYHWHAFQSLSTERQLGMTLGPIPDSSIRVFARDDRLTAMETTVLLAVIRRVDDHYLGKLREQQDKASRTQR